MTVRALFSMGVNVLGGIYFLLAATEQFNKKPKQGISFLIALLPPRPHLRENSTRDYWRVKE